MKKLTRHCSFTTHLCVAALSAALAACSSFSPASAAPARHVLLISVDGLHEQDLTRFVMDHPQSNLARMYASGLNYQRAYAPMPSDSFPGLVALISGALPAQSGVYYDDSYDRSYAAAGSDCSHRGAEVVYDESIDQHPEQVNGGGAINPAQLPRDAVHGCTPVYPHQFVQVNTVFEVVRAHGGQTAWVDKHLAYDFVNGPSGQGVMDLYTPEIAAMGEKTTSFPAYDNLKVTAVINQINGLDSSGQHKVGVPTLFGMNFQNVSVAQKSGEGYLDANAQPGPAIASALTHVDESLGRIEAALKTAHLSKSTLVVLTAKHGQAPIDSAKLRRIDGKLLLAQVNAAAPGALAKASLDDVGLLWLNDRRTAPTVVAALNAHAAELGIAHVYSGEDMPAGFGRATDNRTPDIALAVQPGVVYTHGKKMAEHGGFGEDDRHVALLLSGPGVVPGQVEDTVSTTQVAPTILAALGLDPAALQSVQHGSARVLPGAWTAR
ncbi:putative AlkP superfamily pyrophosphatase or phosphodiesterase [Silvimonas terrae]|uniref:Putative AlkP superfamily pyrophosphatase or phosphodiesterase n=1 Tax=Silvimonas terrae TaxID=300266 RepID=A0A840RIZ8_9NEIS|nr:alkaline phosphatase family protein [Silvimonas terrae]MBB5193679.1 putative AlkP superfamily pyrophosphatase or phosphodiesterase [Silvimonas terrae]